jgi:hypothetical protein
MYKTRFIHCRQQIQFLQVLVVDSVLQRVHFPKERLCVVSLGVCDQVNGFQVILPINEFELFKYKTTNQR